MQTRAWNRRTLPEITGEAGQQLAPAKTFEGGIPVLGRRQVWAGLSDALTTALRRRLQQDPDLLSFGGIDKTDPRWRLDLCDMSQVVLVGYGPPGQPATELQIISWQTTQSWPGSYVGTAIPAGGLQPLIEHLLRRRRQRAEPEEEPEAAPAEPEDEPEDEPAVEPAEAPESVVEDFFDF